MVYTGIKQLKVVNEARELCEGWQWKPLSYLARDTERRNPNKQFLGNNFQYVDIASVDSQLRKITKPQTLLGQQAPSRARKVIKADDIIIATTRPYLRNIAIVPPELNDAICSTGFCVLRVNPTLALPKYIYYSCISDIIIEQLIPKQRGANYPAVTDNDIFESVIPVPYPENPVRSLDIQRRIVARIEALLAEVQESRSIIDKMKQNADKVMESALNQVFGHIRDGLDIKGISHNQIKYLSDVATIERGKFSHRPRNDPKFFGGYMPWIQIQNLPRNYSKYINGYMDTLNDKGIAVSKVFPKGTLVISIAATIGALGILKFDACFPDSLVGITSNSSLINTGFLYWQLLFIKKHLELIAPAAAQKNINLQIISKINIWVPSHMTEQEIIDNYLENIQVEVSKILNFLDQDAKLLDMLEQTILERAFRGEL